MQKQKRQKIKKRVRSKVHGTDKMPRLFVFKSNKHIYAGLADDVSGKTLLAVSDKDGKTKNKNTVDVAGKVGEELAKQAQEGGYKKVVFDRGGYRYHGKIKALAEGARKGGLKF